MHRFTISLDAELAREFDELIRRKRYSNRSEAVRDMLRAMIEGARLSGGRARFSVGCLSYVYNHHERDLTERLASIAHDHHELVISTTHAHIDHEQCIETLILRGRTEDLRRFSDAVVAERGVRHGNLSLVPVEIDKGGPRHQHAHPLS